ncbi:hypothetical protein [Aeoliella mucimassa]|uniref:Uncharacterized protein n=1 Tax=Aeoliella mucimassa TaxID=2527972 RepID=A0A518APW7_9BACT|nr:hypothetical protein [Aeoliella mucimassa]QDU56761.1 hypothetical protein Pan181_29730 [Aeoliella mucimassa]
MHTPYTRSGVRRSARTRITHDRRRARQLNARVFASPDGRLLLVRGNVDSGNMFRQLSHVDDPSQHPTNLASLGFPASAYEELSEATLVSASRALTNWRRLVDHQLRSGRRNQRHQAEAAEVEHLERRLHQLHTWKRMANTAQLTSSSPWLLDESQQRTLADMLEESPSTLLEEYQWIARIVFWLAGKCACRRFTQTLAVITLDDHDTELCEQLRRTLGELHIWQNRCLTENRRELQNELQIWTTQLGHDLILRARLAFPFKKHTLFSVLQQNIVRCRQALREVGVRSKHRVVAAVATIVANDNAIAPLPQRLLSHWIQKDNEGNIAYLVNELIAESKTPGYARMLRAMETLPSRAFEQITFVCQQLAARRSLDDIAWALNVSLDHYIYEPRFDIGRLRRLIVTLESAGVTQARSQLYVFVDNRKTSERYDSLFQFANWVASLPKAVRTPRICKLIWTVLHDFVFPGLEVFHRERVLYTWSDQAAVPRGLAAEALQAWSDKLQALPRSTDGKPAALLKQVRCDQAGDKRQRELHYLRQLHDDGLATEAQLARLHHLQHSPQTNDTYERKALRRVQVSVVHASLELLREQLRTVAQASLGPQLSSRLKDERLRRVMEYLHWHNGMCDEEQQLLAELLAAHEVHGRDYKRKLTHNQPWLKKARRRGINIDHWLAGDHRCVVIAGEKYQLEISHDPMEIFLMGTYFGSCLSLGRENQHSVLANAADANKQVIYVRDSQGHVFARQLIAINDKYELLGYHCYVNEEKSTAERREQTIAAIASFSGSLAARCGLELGEEGEPHSLGPHFWYDDGAYYWHAAAKTALSAAANQGSWWEPASVSTAAFAESWQAELAGWRL